MAGSEVHIVRRGLACLAVLLSLLLSGVHAQAAGFLGIPNSIDGYPTNVGLLILGHSTSAQGQYPAKLVAAMNDASNAADGRHYLAFPAITGGDGGLLWSIVSVGPADLRYDRATASAGVGESPSPQWCQDGAGQRWSCRRSKLEHVLTGTFPIPATGSCADVTVTNSCRAAAQMACTWYDRTLPMDQNPVTQSLSPFDCWSRMDYRIALVQDTTNRSWPVDDFTADGAVDDLDLWPASRIQRARALPCGGTGGVVGGLVDWTCDGVLTPADAAYRSYASWLLGLATDLLDPGRYGAAALDFVFFGHKPVEMGQCNLWPAAEIPTCLSGPHAIRTPEQIAATPDRPYDHYYLPTVFWERRGLEQLFADPALDPRIRPATRDNVLAMWDRSALCYAQGLVEGDWRIPAAVPGRPGPVEADDVENDGGPNPSADIAGCMVADHVHHNDAGGWMMADVWFAGLEADLRTGLFMDGFESGDTSSWSQTVP
ncbi:MAG TPA: hypothetical protein VF017_11780 [Thermoanaerobaculia bacterium]|nr:hypothetical protein [Thermoanaerobaculia bacterium]